MVIIQTRALKEERRSLLEVFLATFMPDNREEEKRQKEGLLIQKGEDKKQKEVALRLLGSTIVVILELGLSKAQVAEKLHISIEEVNQYLGGS